MSVKRIWWLPSALALWVTVQSTAEAGGQPATLPAAVAQASVTQTGPAPAVAEAARSAQTQCHPRIHHDTYAFEDCLFGLLAQEKRASPRRLGIEYFGYVGAMSSERMGMEGAAATAFEFLRRFRRTQRQLKVDDTTLCATLPGDCEVRLARMKIMETSPEFKHPPRRDRSSEHQHMH